MLPDSVHAPEQEVSHSGLPRPPPRPTSSRTKSTARMTNGIVFSWQPVPINREFIRNMDLVSPNIRGAVLSIAQYVAPFEAYMSWSRHRFIDPDNRKPTDILSDPSMYDSVEIFATFSRSVDWTNQEEASRGLRALSQFIRSAECDHYEDEYSFTRKIEDIRTACIEDGFEYKDDPRTISKTNSVALGELNLDGLSTTEGIYLKLKKIDRALVRDQDNLEVIAYSKDLMEAVAGAVLQQRGQSDESIRRMNAASRCHNAMTLVGITTDNGQGKVAEGLTLFRRGMNKLVEGITAMRREDTDEGHGMPGVRTASDTQAQLALSAALLWCHYILDNLRSEQSAPF